MSFDDRIEIDLGPLNAIVDVADGSQLGGGELRAAIAVRVRELSALGVAPGERVMLVHGGSAAFFVDLFAIWACGACAICVNSTVTAPELENLIEFSDVLAIVHGWTEWPLSAHDGRNVLKAPLPDANESAPLDRISVTASADALILFTSGTTGEPKGVVHTFESLFHRLSLNWEHMAPAAMSRTLCTLPTHFGHGLIGNCLTPLLAGGALHLATGGGVQVAGRLAAIVDRYGITFMSSVPSFWKVALKMSPPPEQQCMRQINIGSAPVAAELMQGVSRWSGCSDVRNMYGITETANWTAGYSLTEGAPEDGRIGQMWGGDAMVRDEDGDLKPHGEGELVLRTPSIMRGYFKRPDLTAAVFEDGWYRTGDLGNIDGSGTIRLTGRKKYEINRGGTKISPEEIDLLLERHSAVAEACTFAIEDTLAGQIVAVAVRLNDDNTTVPRLKDWVAANIRRECVPERWFEIEEIPKTDRGKLNRDHVRDYCLKHDGQ